MLAERLARAGAATELWEPAPTDIAPWARQIGTDNLSFSGRPQLIATWPGTGGGRSLILNGHVDAVAADPIAAWTVDPFAGEVIDGRLIGRGAVDMKGGVAAMVIAAEAVIAELGTLPGELIVNTATDEESSGAGTLACIAHGLSGDGVIVPEPTGFDIWVACRGSLTPTFKVVGRSGHAEMPQPPWQDGGAVNAIEKLRVLLDAVEDLRRAWASRPDQQHDLLAPATIVPVLVEGGEWFVTYPSAAQLTCEVMYLPRAADEYGEGRRVEDELVTWLDSVIERSGDEWLRNHPPTIEWASDIPPAEIDRTSPIAQGVGSAAAEIGLDPRVSGFDSWYDGASFIRTRGIPSVAFGPPDVSDAHAVDESVAIDDLVLCAKAIALAITRWCTSKA